MILRDLGKGFVVCLIPESHFVHTARSTSRTSHTIFVLVMTSLWRQFRMLRSLSILGRELLWSFSPNSTSEDSLITSPFITSSRSRTMDPPQAREVCVRVAFAEG